MGNALEKEKSKYFTSRVAIAVKNATAKSVFQTDAIANLNTDGLVELVNPTGCAKGNIKPGEPIKSLRILKVGESPYVPPPITPPATFLADDVIFADELERQLRTQFPITAEDPTLYRVYAGPTSDPVSSPELLAVGVITVARVPSLSLLAFRDLVISRAKGIATNAQFDACLKSLAVDTNERIGTIANPNYHKVVGTNLICDPLTLTVGYEPSQMIEFASQCMTRQILAGLALNPTIRDVFVALNNEVVPPTMPTWLYIVLIILALAIGIIIILFIIGLIAKSKPATIKTTKEVVVV